LKKNLAAFHLVPFQQQATFLNQVATKFTQLAGLKVVVEELVYDPSLPTPPDKPFAFVYHLSIQNQSKQTVTFFGRKWVVRDEDGHTLVVEGDGIVGQYPRLQPGEVFSYNSYHTIATRSIAHGAFFGSTARGKAICVSIPEFTMHLPSLEE
jgi:ApaG protein